MTRLEAAALADGMDRLFARLIELRTVDVYEAYHDYACWAIDAQGDVGVSPNDQRILLAARERLIDLLSDEEPTQPLPRPLEDR